MKRLKRANSAIASRRKRPATARQSKRELLELQRLMGAAIMRPLTAGQRMPRRWVDGRSTQSFVEGFIKPSDRLTSLERLEIYNRQYWFRLLDCFYEDYPGLRAILGERKFAALAEAYLTRCPSSSFTLRNLGRRLEQFLLAEPRLTAPRPEAALEMARLEWAHIVAFDEEAKPAVNVDELLGQTPDRIFLKLQPYLTLLTLSYPFDDFLIAIKEGQGLRKEASHAREERMAKLGRRALSMPRGKTLHLAVHRYDFSVFYKRLNEEQFRLLSALHEGASLTAACERLAHSRNNGSDIADLPIQQWFQDWAALGWFWRPRPVGK